MPEMPPVAEEVSSPALDDPRRPSTSVRVDSLEKEMQALKGGMVNLTKIVAGLLTQQAQPEIQAKLQSEIEGALLQQLATPVPG